MHSGKGKENKNCHYNYNKVMEIKFTKDCVLTMFSVLMDFWATASIKLPQTLFI